MTTRLQHFLIAQRLRRCAKCKQIKWVHQFGTRVNRGRRGQPYPGRNCYCFPCYRAFMHRYMKTYRGVGAKPTPTRQASPLYEELCGLVRQVAGSLR